MGMIGKKTIQLKSGRRVVIRTAEPADAAGVIASLRSVVDEGLYTLVSTEELNPSVEFETKRIEELKNNPSGLIIVAVDDDKIVGMLDFKAGHRRRIAHTGEFGISIMKDYRDGGLGRSMMNAFLEWAAQSPTLEKINLRVNTNNTRAIQLYESLGFQKEGLLLRDMKEQNASYYDTLLMAKFVK